MWRSDLIVPAKTIKQIEDIALKVRSDYGIDEKEFVPIVEIVELQLGKRIRRLELEILDESEMGEEEARSEYDPKKIIVRNDVYESANIGGGRARMTLAHELGHHVLHGAKNGLSRAPSNLRPRGTIPSYHSAEWQASRFASALMMTPNLVRKYSRLEDIKDNFGVSFSAATVRAGQLKLIIQEAKKPNMVTRNFYETERDDE